MGRRQIAALLILSAVALNSAGCRSVRGTWEDRSPSSTQRKFDLKQKMLAGSPSKGVAVGIKKQISHDASAIKVFIRNDGERPITVYRSFRVDRGQFNADSDLFLEVVDTTSGDRLPLRSKAWTDGNDKHNLNSYYQLAPFELVSDVIYVSKYYPLEKGKSYEVTIEYDHGESGFEKGGKWIEMDAWTGRIRSNKVRLVMPL